MSLLNGEFKTPFTLTTPDANSFEEDLEQLLRSTTLTSAREPTVNNNHHNTPSLPAAIQWTRNYPGRFVGEIAVVSSSNNERSRTKRK